MKNKLTIYFILPLILCALNVQAHTYLVNHVEDLASIQAKVTPVDSIVFVNKIWNDSPIELKFNSTDALPVMVISIKNDVTLSLCITYCNSNMARIVESFSNNIVGKMMLKVDPQFNNISKQDFSLKSTSPLKNKGNDGKDIGAIYVNEQLKL